MSRKRMLPPDCLTRRRLLQFSFTLAALAAARCGHDARRGERPGRTLRMLYWTDERPTAPQWGAPAQFLVFLPLVRRHRTTGDFEPCLAREWERSADWRTWTVRLRDDVRWHDGVPVTAHDIRFTLELLQRPEVAWIRPGSVQVSVIDELTFRATYRERLIGSPADDWTVYYPRHLLESLDPKSFHDWEFWLRPVGNGPYRYARHVPATMVEFVANRNYFRGPPAIERVVLRLGRMDDPAALVQLLSGNVHVISVRDRRVLLKLAQEPRFIAYDRIGGTGYHALVWNHRRPEFGDPRVRRALLLAIDRRELHRALNLPPDAPILDAPATPRQIHRRDLPEPLPYDPAGAARLLDEAGWSDADGDGVREHDGRPVVFTALTPPEAQAATFVQAQLRRMGIRMEIRPMPYASMRSRLLAGDFEAAFMQIHYVDRLAANFGAGSILGYSNPEVSSLTAQIPGTLDPERLDAAYRRLAAIFQSDAPAAFLAPFTMTTVVHRAVRGLSAPHRVEPLESMDELWLEEELPPLPEQG